MISIVFSLYNQNAYSINSPSTFKHSGTVRPRTPLAPYSSHARRCSQRAEAEADLLARRNLRNSRVRSDATDGLDGKVDPGSDSVTREGSVKVWSSCGRPVSFARKSCRSPKIRLLYIQQEFTAPNARTRSSTGAEKRGIDVKVFFQQGFEALRAARKREH